VDGTDWLAAWRKRTLARLQAWGFNTIANWSDPALGALHQLPYTRELDIRGDFGTVATGYDWWGRMPDPFDPRFRAGGGCGGGHGPRRACATIPGCSATSPTTNWPGPRSGPQGRWALAVGTLHGEARSAAKQAFIADCWRRNTARPASSPAAWGIALASWEALDATNFPAPEPSEAHPAIAAD
jgi:hypothetical protein